jgi:hypothetical protein
MLNQEVFLLSVMRVRVDCDIVGLSHVLAVNLNKVRESGTN